MNEQIEISMIDLRYECCRMRSFAGEKILLNSILTHGIRHPLQGVTTEGGTKILLNGFKRIRCAKKLGIGTVPWDTLGDEEPYAILELLRLSNEKSLTIIEQARLIDELKGVHNMSTADIALLLEKSKAWVSVRTGIIKEMSRKVMDKIFTGKFPAYSYMYTIRQFMRINGVGKKDVDNFVDAVSGNNLSIRDIESLANGYFKGSSEFRNHIENGNLEWGLSRMRESSKALSGCTGIEQNMIKNLEISQKYIQKVIYRSTDKRLKTASFHAQANILTGGILRQINPFEKAVRKLHDRSGQAKRHLSSP